ELVAVVPKLPAGRTLVEILDLLPLGAADVVNRDDAAVQRTDDVLRAVVTERLQDVVANAQVVVVDVEPVRRDRQARQQLLLHTHVVVPGADALGIRIDLSVPARYRSGRRDHRASRYHGTERRGQLAVVDFASGREIHAPALTLSDVVFVDVGPG